MERKLHIIHNQEMQDEGKSQIRWYAWFKKPENKKSETGSKSNKKIYVKINEDH